MSSGRKTNKTTPRNLISEFNPFADRRPSSAIISNLGRNSDVDLQDDISDNQINQFSSQQYPVIENSISYPQVVSPDSTYNLQSSSSQLSIQDSIQQNSFHLELQDTPQDFLEPYSENQYQEESYNFSSEFSFNSNQQQFDTSQELHIDANQQDQRYHSGQIQFLSQQQPHYESQRLPQPTIRQTLNRSISQAHPRNLSRKSILLPPPISQGQIESPQRSLVSSAMISQQQLRIPRGQKRIINRQINPQQHLTTNQCSSITSSMQSGNQQKSEQQLPFQQVHLQRRLSSPIQELNQILAPSIQRSDPSDHRFICPGNTSYSLPSEPGPSRIRNREIPTGHHGQYAYINYNQNPQLGYMYRNSHSNSSINPLNHHQPSSTQSSHTQCSPTSPFHLLASPVQPVDSEENQEFHSPRVISNPVEWQAMMEQRNSTCTRNSMEDQSGPLIHNESPNYGGQYQIPHPPQMQREIASQLSIQCPSPPQEAIQQALQSRTVSPIPVLSFEIVDETFERMQIEQPIHQVSLFF